jgi:nitrite reductase/ring-hydroxylating ferredoxin subunit/uncharacterized membrane protein
MGDGRVACFRERALAWLQGQAWLDSPSYRFEHAIALLTNLLGDAKEPVLDGLHGTWLGHPLHPPLTDVPIGAWTAALVLDLADARHPRDDGFQAATRHCVGVGVVGAAGAMLAGVADWQYSQDYARRVGLVHGLVNLAATGLQTASWVERGRGRRRTARRLSGLGYVAALAGAYFGGDLVSRHGVGVDHGDRRLSPRGYVPVLADADLEEGRPRLVRADDVEVLLVRVDGAVHALGARCPHLGGPLHEGWLRGDVVVCPWHGSSYDLATGAVRRGPATTPLPCFTTRVVEGRIEVRCRPPVPQAPPGSVVAAEQENADAGH